jgi:hypothetical protein
LPQPVAGDFLRLAADTYEQSIGFNKCLLSQAGHKRRCCQDASL